jgi:hypothetical protein
MSESSKTNEFLRLLMANQKRIYAFILATVPNQADEIKKGWHAWEDLIE